MLVLVVLVLSKSAATRVDASGQDVSDVEEDENSELQPNPPLMIPEFLGTGKTRCPSVAFGAFCISGQYDRLKAPTNVEKGGTEVDVSLTLHGITQVDSFNLLIGLEMTIYILGGFKDNMEKDTKARTEMVP